MEAEVVIVGSGAAGVSAAVPLLDAGLRVILLDPGVTSHGPSPPEAEYLGLRRTDAGQWRWMLGQEPPRAAAASSPKFRAPSLAHVFRDYAAGNSVTTENFALVGSLAEGGLTAAWGAGVATFSASEMADWPVSRAEMEPYYRAVAERMGVSGAAKDDLSGHFGLDGIAAHSLPLDAVGAHVEARYRRVRAELLRDGFALGRARLAVLADAKGERRGCEQLGLCLWGCPRRAIYAAHEDLLTLRRRANLQHVTGVLADDVVPGDGGWTVRLRGRADGRLLEIRARNLVLAAGTVATTRLVLRLTGRHGTSVRLLSTPTAAFAVFFPALFGRPQEPGSGLAQHWYALGEGEDQVCGGLFPTTGLPVTEFVTRSPFARRIGIDMMRWILPATAVGNTFANGAYSAHSLTLKADGGVHVRGGFAPDFEARLRSVARQMRSVFRRLGGIVLPGSFTPADPGSDVHYAGTLPMRLEPAANETSRWGELHGAPGVFVVDGSVLPSLPSKSHTLTVMANAARIGDHLARSLRRAG